MAPKLLVLVRHGQYSGNVGDFPSRTSQAEGLNDLGHSQAEAARKWLATNGFLGLPQRRTSPLLRAQETGRHIFDTGWTTSPNLVERNRGRMSHMSNEEAAALFPDDVEMKERSPIFWQPPGGESLAVEVPDRIRTELKTMDDRPAIWSVHSEFMWSARFLFAGFTDDSMNRMQRAPKPRFQDIGNGRLDIYAEHQAFAGLWTMFRSVDPSLSLADPRFDTGWCLIPEPLPCINATRSTSGKPQLLTGDIRTEFAR